MEGPPLRNGSLERLAAVERGQAALEQRVRELYSTASDNRERIAVLERIHAELEKDLNGQGAKVNAVGRNVWVAIGGAVGVLGVLVPILIDKS